MIAPVRRRASCAAFGLALAFLCAAGPEIRAAEPSESVDLSWQLSRDAHWNQGPVGLCHDFAAVALVEAAYYRRYRPKRLDLAPQDVFVCCTGACSMTEYKAVDGTMQCRLNESGYPYDDVRFILEHGALPSDACHVYSAFSSRLYRTQENLNKIGQLLIEKSPEAPPASSLPVLTHAELTAMEGAAHDAEKRRAVVLAQVMNFHASRREFPSLTWPELQKISPEECGNRSADQKETLLRELRAERPVVLTMSLRGLASWNRTEPPGPKDPPDDKIAHAFVAIGFRTVAGRIVFSTRNSWSASPDVSELELCRVYDMTMLFSSNETPSEPPLRSDVSRN